MSLLGFEGLLDKKLITVLKALQLQATNVDTRYVHKEVLTNLSLDFHRGSAFCANVRRLEALYRSSSDHSSPLVHTSARIPHLAMGEPCAFIPEWRHGSRRVYPAIESIYPGVWVMLVHSKGYISRRSQRPVSIWVGPRTWYSLTPVLFSSRG